MGIITEKGMQQKPAAKDIWLIEDGDGLHIILPEDY